MRDRRRMRRLGARLGIGAMVAFGAVGAGVFAVGSPVAGAAVAGSGSITGDITSGATNSFTVARGVTTGTIQVGTFVDTDGSTSGELHATIHWGDGTSEAGSLSCSYVTVTFTTLKCTVSGSHTYTAGGTYQVTMTVTDADESGTVTVSGGTATVTSRAAPPPLVRVYGTDAIGTAIAVSQREYQAGSAGAVVLARTTYFSDALAGGPLAAAMQAPLLLTEGAPKSASIDPRVLTEIERVLPKGKTVYILGGPLALSPNIDTALQAVGYKTTRIAGADEYATAVDIAQALGNPSTVFETTGLGFADSLSADPAAIKTDGAILLTDGTTQSPETAAYLAAHPTDTRYAIGGPLAAYGADPTAIPVYGQTLFGTSAAVAKRFFPGPSTFGVAAAWQDALAGGVFVGARRGPLLLVPTHLPLPSPIVSYLSSLAGPQGYVFGGPIAVPTSVATAVHLAEG